MIDRRTKRPPTVRNGSGGNLGTSRRQNGEFAQQWIVENQAGRPSYRQKRKAEKNHEIEEVGARLRSLFAWADEDEETEDDKTEVKA